LRDGQWRDGQRRDGQRRDGQCPLCHMSREAIHTRLRSVYASLCLRRVLRAVAEWGWSLLPCLPLPRNALCACIRCQLSGEGLRSGLARDDWRWHSGAVVHRSVRWEIYPDHDPGSARSCPAAVEVPPLRHSRKEDYQSIMLWKCAYQAQGATRCVKMRRMGFVGPPPVCGTVCGFQQTVATSVALMRSREEVVAFA